MAAPSIPDIMSGLQTRLATISGLNTADIRPGHIIPPCAAVGVPQIPNYRLAMRRGTFETSATITVLVSEAIDQAGQLALAAYANPTGDSSVVAAIEADRTLGGAVDDCFVESFRPLGVDEVGVIGYYGGLFTLYIAAQGGT